MTYSLNTFFGYLGLFIGNHALSILLLSLSFFGISLLGPILRLDIKTSIKSGFTRGDAASLREITAYRNFFNSTGEPWYMALYAIAKNGTSILDDEQTDELTSFYKYITQEMSIDDPNSHIHYHYDLCYPFCDFNSQLWNLLNYHTYYKLRYPLSTVGPYKVNVGKFIFNRTVNSRGIVTSFGVAAMYFATFINDNTRKGHLEQFETQVLREVEEHNAVSNHTLRIVLHGANTVSKEVRRGVWYALPYYALGVVLLIVFVFFGFIMTAISYKQYRKMNLLLAVAALLSPTLAAFSAIGLMLLIGYHINMLILISPFLTLAIGIGVDDAFLMTNTWLRQCSTAYQRHLSRPERLRFVLEKVGVSMTITSLTNVLGFALGCIAPAPEIQLFCAAVALSMLLDLLYQLFFYAPLVVLFTDHETYDNYILLVKKNKLSIIGRINTRISNFTKCYSKFVTSLWAEFLAVGVLIMYMLTAVSEITKLQSNVDARTLLPGDSQSVEGIRIMNDIVWTDYVSIIYIIQNPPNFSDPAEYRKFLLMVKSIESMRNSLGPPATTLWLKDYLRYLANPNASELDVLFGITAPEANNTIYLQNGLDMSQFNIFINTEPYSAWKHGVRYEQDNENRTIITSMLLMMGYNGTNSIAGKAILLKKCREMCARHSEYKMVPFDTDAELVDVILAVPSTTFSAILFTVFAIGLIFLVFSMNLTTAMLATASIASICTGVLGFLNVWKCDLDPVLMVAVIMSAGLGVDYTVHIILHYFVNGERYDNKVDRIDATLRACAISLLQAGISTLLVMFPVLFSPIGVYAIIAKSIVLVAIIGFLHGLFIIPVILTLLPSCLLHTCCCECIKSPDFF